MNKHWPFCGCSTRELFSPPVLIPLVLIIGLTIWMTLRHFG